MTKKSVKKASPELVRQINRATILEMIKNEGPISRAQIARKTKFSKVTVSNIIRNLLSENILREKQIIIRQPGVNPILYSLNCNDNLVGSISIDTSHTIVAIVNIKSKIIAKESFSTSTENSEEFLNYCIERLENLKHKVNTDKLIGIGISIPGTLNFEKTKLIHSVDLGWQNVPLMDILKKSVKEKIVIENDTRCISLAEWNFSPNPAIRDSDIFIFIEYGIACNFKLDSHLCSGRHNLAGEFGNLIVNLGSEDDESNKIGYLQDYISNRATVDYYKQLTNESRVNDIDQEMDWIIRQFLQQQPEAVQTINRFIRYLALGIANLINLLDPKGIIIYGKTIKIWHLIHDDLMKNILKYTLHQDEKLFHLFPSSLDGDASIIGAATLILSQIFKYPILSDDY